MGKGADKGYNSQRCNQARAKRAPAQGAEKIKIKSNVTLFKDIF